jgi:D-arabinose 1-dehydrogenase-like Zn-dependent alcohol dehydrogenase
MSSSLYRSNKADSGKEDSILAARIHQYQNPLIVERIRKPMITSGEQVLVRVGASGLCHSDLHLINGEWEDLLPVPLPITPGHEVAGWIEEMGDSVGWQKRYSLVSRECLVSM